MPDPRPIRMLLEPSHLERQEQFAAFLAQKIEPLAIAHDDQSARDQARELVGLLGNGQWYEPIAAEDLRSCCLIREALAEVSPLADAVYALQALGSMPLVLAGTNEQQERWLGPLRAGQLMSAFAMTEPNAGSDVASMETRATMDGDHYVLNGTKTFISNAGIADFYTVFASTNPAAAAKGISCFVVPADTPGFRFVKAQILSEPHPLGEITFENCRIPASHRLGAEGKGLGLGLATLDRLRPTVGAAACGMAARALTEALDHLRSRRQFGQRLAEFQLMQQKIARMATDLAAARLLVYTAAWEKDHGAKRIGLESAMAKSFATEAAGRIIDDAVQILGGRGVLAESVVDRLYRAARSLRIYEGTTEIQHLIIGSHFIQQADEASPTEG